MTKARTVITAPQRPARPAAKRAPVQQRQPRPAENLAPIGAKSGKAALPDQGSASHVTPQSEEARTALSEAELIERNLADGLGQIERQRADHQTRLAAIAERLAAIQEALDAVDVPVLKLQQEQERLPREVAAARALVLASAGTKAEGQAQEQLATLQARAAELPFALASSRAAEQEQRAALSQEQNALGQEKDERNAALADLAELAEAQREAARRAQAQLGAAKYASILAERQAKVAALSEAEARAAEARAALADLDTAAQDALAAWPDLKLSYQQQFVPVVDGVTRRLEAGIAYRENLLTWYYENSGDWALGMDYEWFRPDEFEWSSLPQYMKRIIGVMEQRLAKHISDQQSRIR